MHSKLQKHGFLSEYLMEKYSMLMIVPEKIKLNFAAYNEWKKNNIIKPILNEKYSLVEYKL